MRIPFSPKWKRKWTCLNDAQLAAYVDGKQPPAERARAEKHLAGCPTCRESVALLLRSERETPGEVPSAWLARVSRLGQEQPRSAIGWGWAAVAAGFLIAVGAITLAYRPRPQTEIAATRPAAASNPAAATSPVTPDEVRNVPKPSSTPVIIAPTDGATISRRSELRWQGLAAAVSYEVRVLNAAGDTVWKSSTNQDHLQLPRDATLHSGEKYFVLISANLPTGKTVRAQAVSFSVGTD